MSEINPISRLYSDITHILNTLTIKYNYRAEELETRASKEKADRYINALAGTDTFYQYDDYSIEEFNKAGITDAKAIAYYQKDRFSIPSEFHSKLLTLRRERELNDYVETNNYYRMLTGLPDLEDKDYIYVPKDLCDRFKIPEDIPVHEIGSKLGNYYLTLLNGVGFFDELVKKYPKKEYLKHVGKNIITLSYARRAKNFAILSVDQENIMESTYREFIRSYEKARIYFMSTVYTYEFRHVIPYYENFIALCIFVMAIQQVSVRGIQNAVEREFYDEYMVKLLYETYGLPYFSKIDQETQKQICQNINILIQNKATNKVILDIASLLGFSDISIYQYYLIKEHNFDDRGRPIIKTKQQVNTATGKMETVYDREAMMNVYFQKVPLDEENIKEALTDPVNRVEYSEVTYYDPFWWEDDDLHSEIWDKSYNYIETKYLGSTIPYRLTELVFQSVILLRMIMDKHNELSDIVIQLPKITNSPVKLADTVILFFALISKKMGISGQIMTLPSKIAHILETNDQVINKENEHIEILSFNFDAFSEENIEETKAILAPFFKRREYRVSNGHDVDLRADGTQDTSAPTHLLTPIDDETDLDEFISYIKKLSIPDASPEEKRVALNKAFENVEALYLFLSYHMSKTTDMEEYYALKKFYETAFYSNETAKMFEVDTEDGRRPAKTFEEYFLYTNSDIYEFLQNIEDDPDKIYSYIDHVIYKLEEVVDNIGYLYTLNDGSSPLIELLQIMITFFKSYIMDFVDMSSLMVIDWEMENTIRFFGNVEHIHKTDKIEEHFGKEFMDLLNKVITHYRIEDRIALNDYIRSHKELFLEDGEKVYDMEQYFRMLKIESISDTMTHYDVVNGITGTIKIRDNLSFNDCCYKIEKEG